MKDNIAYNILCNGDCLENIRSVYTRMMYDQLLPEIEDEPEDSPRRRYSAKLHDALVRWCEISPAKVVNRVYPSSSNSSKIYQSEIIRSNGFDIPDTLLTNDPAQVREFLNEKKDVIFKSVSGARSIVTKLSDDHLRSLDRVANCPTMFQEFIDGKNIRVHVVGKAVFATQVKTDAVDYRYSGSETGSLAELSPTTLPDNLIDKCVGLTKNLGLAFSGIDLMRTEEGTVYCLEVNPCPGYSYYEANTGQPISLALAKYLAHASRE